MKYWSPLTIFLLFVALVQSKPALGEDYLKAKQILLRRLQSGKYSVQLSESEGAAEDAFNAQVNLIKASKAPVSNPFADYEQSLGTQDEIKNATKVTNLNLLSEAEIKEFKKKVEDDVKAAKLISKYIEAEKEKNNRTSEEDEGIRQLYEDILDLQHEWKETLEQYSEMLEVIESANAYKLSARFDLTRMYLAKVRYLQSVITYKTHLIARDLAHWYEDYFKFKGDTDGAQKAAGVSQTEIALYKDTYKQIDVEYQFYDKTRNETVGPAMLIFGLLFGIIGLFGVVWYIKTMQRKQNSQMFGLQSSRAEKNDMMIKFYTQNPDNEAPTKFLQRLSEASMTQASQKDNDFQKVLDDVDEANQIKS